MKNNNTKILLVEDEQDTIEMFQTRLVMDGFNVTVARDGDEGFRTAKKLQPDLILLDIIMPNVDGFTMLTNVKKDSQTKNIPVIICSNLSNKDEIEKGYRLGAKDFIVKSSVTPSQLVQKVIGFLALKK
jgi:CheY-like chemotaxis protein